MAEIFTQIDDILPYMNLDEWWLQASCTIERPHSSMPIHPLPQFGVVAHLIKIYLYSSVIILIGWPGDPMSNRRSFEFQGEYFSITSL